jgi:hypothetical protein
MSLIYKAGQKVIDINKVRIELPQETYGGGAGDIMKELGGGAGSAEPAPQAPPEGGSPEDDDLMKELKGGK